MSCEEYREALTEAAAAGSKQVMPRNLRGHLDACAVCHEFFSQEQQLFAAIDSGVRSRANADVPASLLPRFHARLDEKRSAQGRFAPWLVVAAVGVSTALLIAFATRSRRPLGHELTKQNATVSLEPATVTPLAQRAAGDAPPLAATKHGGHFGSRRSPDSLQLASSNALEAIVPPEEREALARWVAAQQQESELRAAVVVGAPDAETAPLRVSELEIADLEVKPLPRLEGGPPDVTQEK